VGVLDGVKKIFLRSGEPVGLDPNIGRIYKWVEKVGADVLYKYKDENGVVGTIGTSGAVTTFPWMLQAGHSNLPSNGTESAFAYGHNNANDGVTMMRDGFIKAMSVRVEPGSTGSATYIITKNNIQNNVAGQRVVVDGTVNSEGGIDNTSAALVFATPFAYSYGDQIEVRAITSNWGNTGSDSTVLVHMEDTL